MGLSCRCCKKKGRCVCKACPTIASESLALEIDYKQFDIDGQPFDGREDIPNGPLFGPEPPYPEGFEVQHTCGFPRPKATSDLEQGINGCGEPYPPFDSPLPCGEFAATMIDPETGEPYQVICPEGYTCDGDKPDEVGFCEPIPGEIKLDPECSFQYDKYTCQANGPRMGRAGPSKKSTFFGIGLIPENRDLIDCTDGGNCPQGYKCVESTDPPEKIQIKDPLPEPTPCDDDDPFVLDCPTGYECRCNKCEPEKVDAPIKSFCELEKTPCGMRVPCPDGYECVTNPDTDESFCEPLSGELTKDFLQHPIQAQFGLYPCENPHKNEICAPQGVPLPCDIPDCIPPIGKLPDQCEKCADSECVDHFGDGYKCNRDGDCEKEDANPCPEGYECRLDTAHPRIEDFPPEVELPFGYIGCTDTDCEKEYGPGFKCNSNDKCEKDPADGTDENCEGLFGESYKYHATQPMRNSSGNKYVCDPDDPEVPNCEDLTNSSAALCVNKECHEPIPNCQGIGTNCLPVEIENEPDWIFQEHDGLPVFLVPTDGLPYGPLPLTASRLDEEESKSCGGGINCPDGYDCSEKGLCVPIRGGARKRRYDELWKGDDPDKLPTHIGACNKVDVTNGECTPDCCYETFGDPWLPNHKWICKGRMNESEIEKKPYTIQNPNIEDPENPGTMIGCVDQLCADEFGTGWKCAGEAPDDAGSTPAYYYCEGPSEVGNEACYLEPIDPYSNKEDELDPLIRDFPEFRELACPDIGQDCGPDAGTEIRYFAPNSDGVFVEFGGRSIPEDCTALTSMKGDSYCEKIHGLGFECQEAQPTGDTDCNNDAECLTRTGIPGTKCVTLDDGSKECYYPISCFRDNTKCPNGFDCVDDECQVDCEEKYGPGAKCVDLVEPGDKEDRWCQPPCSDDICEEEYGPGFKCNDDGDCELVRDRDLDSRIPRPIGEESRYDPTDNKDKLYFGHTSIWGGANNSKLGVGAFNLDTTKIRTRLYLDYGYHLHYPFDKGHMNTELVPSGCPVEKTPKTDVWKYKGNKGHRVPYPKVNTITIGNRYPSTHSFIDDEEGVDDFTKVGSGPYFSEYCDRAMGTEEPGGLEGLGDPVPTNWNREANPSKDIDGNTIYAPQHENDDYGPKYDPNGIVKGCNPSFVVPCDTNPSEEIEFDYLSYVRSEDMMDEDGLNRTGVCKKDMDDWRVSNQSVFSHTQVPSGPVGGLIIDKVKFIEVDYNFPAHTTTPDLWLWNNLTRYGSSFGAVNWKFNRVYIPPITLPVYMAVYYNSKIGDEPIRYDDKKMDINQFLPPPNGWLENIWQLGDIANPLDVDDVQPNSAILYSRPTGSGQGDEDSPCTSINECQPGLCCEDYQPNPNDPPEKRCTKCTGSDLNAKKGYKHPAMSNQDYIDKYDHLPVDRHWDMPSKDTCANDLPEIDIECGELIVYSRWTETAEECNDETDLSSDDEQCVCVGYEPFNEGEGWERGQAGRSPTNDCEADLTQVVGFLPKKQGVIWKAPPTVECDDKYCGETFDGSKCDGDGNCISTTGCPEGYKCGCPDDDRPPIVEPLPPQNLGESRLNIYEIEMEVSHVLPIPNPDYDPTLDPPDPNIPATIDGPIIKATVKPTKVTADTEDGLPSAYWSAKSQPNIINPLEPLSQRKNFHQAINHDINTPYWDEYQGPEIGKDVNFADRDARFPFLPIPNPDFDPDLNPPDPNIPATIDSPIYKDADLFVNNPPEDELYLSYARAFDEEDWFIEFDELYVSFEDLPDDVVKVVDVKVKVRQKGRSFAEDVDASENDVQGIDRPKIVGDLAVTYSMHTSASDTLDHSSSPVSNKIPFYDGEARTEEYLGLLTYPGEADGNFYGLAGDAPEPNPDYDPTLDSISIVGGNKKVRTGANDPNNPPFIDGVRLNGVFWASQPCPEYIDRLDSQWSQPAQDCECESNTSGEPPILNPYANDYKLIFSQVDEKQECVVPSTDVLAFEINPDYNSKSDWDEVKLKIAVQWFIPNCEPLKAEGFKYVWGGEILDGNGDPVPCNDDPNTDCEQITGVPGSRCHDGVCFAPPTCQKPNKYCIPCDPCDCGTEEGFHLQSCGDLASDGDPVPCGDDVKLTKHLFDFWNDGTPFPSNNGDIADGYLTWFPAQVDQYGEVQLKPYINNDERDIERKYPERNLFGVEPPDPKDNPEPCGCGDEPCPPGFICEEDLCIPGEGSLISTVTYPPLLYSGGTTGGYKTQCGIKNLRNTNDTAIKQWWFQHPYHPGTPLRSAVQAGDAYATYLAQIGVPLDYHWYDVDWLRQQFAEEQAIIVQQQQEPPQPIGGDHTDVREVYRTLSDNETLGWYIAGRESPFNNDISFDIRSRSSAGLPVGSYHGRDGMIRYNIHPWAQIYNQIRITDALLEMGRDFHEVQQVLSSIELECRKGVFKNGTPTVVEPFGYDETGNIQFQLNQPHGSHLAELTTPRILNYRPTATMPPGTADRIKIGGPGQAMCIYEYQYPMTMGGSFMTVIYMPGGDTHGVPLFKIPTVESTIQPFVSRVAHIVQTYPGFSRGASATKEEETFTNRAVGTVFGPIEFHQGPQRFTWTDPSDGIEKPFPYNLQSPGEMGHARNVSQYRLNDGAYVEGKVYGVSKWPHGDSTHKITTGTGIDSEKFPDNFYQGGHGYFDPKDLQKKNLQNLDPDMGLFTYCFIAGMSSRESLPGLPRAWTFGMVGGSFHYDFDHSMQNGNANSPKSYDFVWPGTEGWPKERTYGHIRALEERRKIPGFEEHYFSKYDYEHKVEAPLADNPKNAVYDEQFELKYHKTIPDITNPTYDPTNPLPEDGEFTYIGNIAVGKIIDPDGNEKQATNGLDKYSSEALLVKFMKDDMTDDPTEFLRQYYYAQVYKIRPDGPITTTYDPSIPVEFSNYKNVKDLEGVHDVNLVLKREGREGRLVEGPAASTWWGLPEVPRYYKTAKYQRLDGEDCVDTYDKECAVGGSSPCGDVSEEWLVLYTLDKNEECGDCAVHRDNGDFLIDTDDWVCVEGQPVEDDEEAYCGRDADGNPRLQFRADKYCEDMYGKGYTCSGGSGEEIRCKAPMTCRLQGLLPANMDSADTGVMDRIITIPPHRTVGLENILPVAILDSYLMYDDDDDEIIGIKDLGLYYIANQYGSDGSIAPNGQIITDEFLRDLDPFYFYDAPNYFKDNPTRVSLRGAVLDSREVPGKPGWARVFFSVGHPDVRPDFAPQEYICAKMTDPTTGLHNSEVIQDQNNPTVVSYGAADMNQCIKTSRFYSGERSDFVPLHGNRTWHMFPGLVTPPATTGDGWAQGEVKPYEAADTLGVTPFHWPWAIGDLCVDWAAGSPRRDGNMGDGIDGRHGFNHENALENVKKYYLNSIRLYGPEDNEDLERTVTHNEFPNSHEAELYKLAIISGTTNTGDMLFFSDSHRQKNDILQAKPPCKLWANIHDFKWPLTPATGINTPAADPCNQTTPPVGVDPTENVQLQVRIDPPENTGGGEPEGDPETEPRVNTVHGKLKINISEKPIIRFNAGGTAPGVDEPDKLWFAIDDDTCMGIDVEAHDPPVPCDPDDNKCDDGYECRTIEGCSDPNTYCMPEVCTPVSWNLKKTLKEYREELGFQHLVLQPNTNPVLDNHIRCPLHHIEVPHWGPKVQLKSALFNRDLITIDECSVCDIDCDCSEPDDPEPLPPLDPEQICGRWDGDEECPDGYDCLCHTCQQEPFKQCLKADAYGCRKCLDPTSPTITITEPEDQSSKIHDPDDETAPDGFAQDCTRYIDILDNSGDDDTGCGSAEDCYGALDPTVERYSNFREQYPYITTEEIQCGDPCQFLNICPPGFVCNDAGDSCDPIPFAHIPALNGIVDIKVDVTPGAGASTEDDSKTPELTEFEIKRVVFTTVQLQTEDPNANDYLKPILNTTLAVEGVELEDGVWGMKWDTTNSFTGYTPDGIFEIKAAIYDTSDLRCIDVATVRLGELDDRHQEAVDEIYNELLAL
jgi:hypothetical protein